jgi:hypothetical protein
MMTVRDAAMALIRHPIRIVVARWHWKSAIFSGLVRGVLFFSTNLTAGIPTAMRAAAVESAMVVPLVGVLGACVQAFSDAEPPWAATLVTAVLIPALAQTTELAVHWTVRTPQLGSSLLASLMLSVWSTAFSLFAMRRGVLVVGRGSRSLGDDLKSLPRMLADFVLCIPRLFGARRNAGT